MDNETINMWGDDIPVMTRSAPEEESVPVVADEPELIDGFNERFEGYKALVAAALSGNIPMPPRTNEIDDTDEKLAYAMMAAAASVIAAGGGGILHEEYVPLYGFSVTTAVTEDHGDHPFARSSVTGRLDKRYKYRVTVNGESYVLPSQLFDYTEITSSTGGFNIKVIEYLGNSSLFRLSDDGLLNEKYPAVPFLVVSDDEGSGYLDMYTKEAGDYTVIIEQVVPTFERILNSLIYGQEHVPFQTNSASSTYEVFSVGVNRILEAAKTAFALGNGNVLSAFGAFAAGSSNTVSGTDAVAIGKINTASGSAATALGWGNTASGTSSIVKGFMSAATGSYSDASGQLAVASGNISHAEGDGVVASARASHVEGGGTIADASHRYVHVGGVNNAVSTETGKTVSITRRDKDGNVVQTNNQTLGKYAEVIGNGDSDQSRSNARTLDWSGNEELAGSLTLGLGTADETTITAAELKALLAML